MATSLSEPVKDLHLFRYFDFDDDASQSKGAVI